MVTPDQLERVGRACFGENWQHDMGRALGVGDRKIRYWMAADPRYPMPPEIGVLLISIGQEVRDRIYHALRDIFPN